MNPRTFRTGGYNDDDRVRVDPGIHKCGKVADGVCFEHALNGRWIGGWVLAFTDLEWIYLEAKRRRTGSRKGVDVFQETAASVARRRQRG